MPEIISRSLTTRELEFVKLFRKGLKKYHIALEAVANAGYSAKSRRSQSVRACLLMKDKAIWDAIFHGPPKWMTTACMHCHGTFERRHHSSRYCSVHCRDLAANRRERLFSEPKACLNCGGAFFGKRNTVHCSPECRAALLAKRNRERRGIATPEEKALWRDRTQFYRGREKAALKALKQLGIKV